MLFPESLKMLNISGRPAKLSGGCQIRTEFHGDAEVPAIDVKLTFAISEDELDELLGPGAHDAWFINGVDGKPAEPRFRTIESIRLAEKLEHVDVRLLLGLAREPCVLSSADLSRVTLTPQTGGMCEVVALLQARAQPKERAAIESHLNLDCELDVSVKPPEPADDGQDQLPLDPDDDDPAAGMDPHARRDQLLALAEQRPLTVVEKVELRALQRALK
jgi:hypothetical protein